MVINWISGIKSITGSWIVSFQNIIIFEFLKTRWISIILPSSRTSGDQRTRGSKLTLGQRLKTFPGIRARGLWITWGTKKAFQQVVNWNPPRIQKHLSPAMISWRKTRRGCRLKISSSLMRDYLETPRWFRRLWPRDLSKSKCKSCRRVEGTLQTDQVLTN